jgi:uncharacterized membrane protein YozB (DUF420 family)
MAFHPAKNIFSLCFKMKQTAPGKVKRWACQSAEDSAAKQKTETMKKLFVQKKVRARMRSVFTVAALLALNVLPAFAQSTTFSSTTLQTGISNSLAVIMLFGFVLGIFSVIYGGFAIRRGDVDQGKMSILGGAIIAAAPAVVYAFYKIFGLDASSSVGVGTFN